MFTSSPQIIQLLTAFAPVFSAPTLAKVIDLVCGVILAPGRRTITSALRAIGRDSQKTFCNYHRVLARDRWSAMRLSQILLSLLVDTFLEQDQPIDILADETLERRRGKKIAYKGWYRDAVRSTQSVTVTTLGIRWLCLCVLVAVPWSSRRWALPFFTIPVCSQKICQKRNRTYRGCAGLTIDALVKVRQWMGNKRAIRFIGDAGFTNIELVLFNQALKINHIGRLKLNAALFDEPTEQPANKPGPKPKKGKRQPTLAMRAGDPATEWTQHEIRWYGGQSKTVQLASGTALWYVCGDDPAPLRWVLARFVDEQGEPEQTATAFFSSDVDTLPEEIVSCYAERWNIEVFFEEVRACLGFETQRGWSNKTIGRTTPCLFGIFSLIVILGKHLYPEKLPVRQAAWYSKEEATFRDVLSAVREHIWKQGSQGSHFSSGSHWRQGKNNTPTLATEDKMCLIPRNLLYALQEIACYAM